MKIAVVHEWLPEYAGAERILEQMLECHPEADLFSLFDFLPPDSRGCLRRKPVRTSFIQKLPWARTRYRWYLPLMPLAVEQFDLSGYDLVISNSYAVAKGVLTGPDQLHLCMCCSPMRYAWDLQHAYLTESGLNRGLRGWMAKWLLNRMRVWDCRTANGVDVFIAISKFIARRISKVYRRVSTVVYPPVAVDEFPFQDVKEDFYLTASRLVPYKRTALIVEAFNRMPQRRLVVIGEGPDLKKVRAKAGPNVTILGHQPHGVLKDHLQRARAFVFAAEEDFGIAPLEAQACGTPVIAFDKGGVRETVQGLNTAEPTGVFFAEQTQEAIQAAIADFERVGSKRIHPEACRRNALRFAPERFRREWTALVEREWERFLHGEL